MNGTLKNLIFAVILCLICVLDAHAQSSYPVNAAMADNTLGAVMPYRGTYYDPVRAGGVGMQVDVWPSGFTFITVYAYQSDGSQVFYIVQGTYTPSDELTRWTTGVIGTVKDSKFYTASGGDCLGDGCSGHHQVVQFTNIVPTFTWLTSREVIMTAGSQSWHMIAPNVDTGSDADFIPGTWQVTYACDVGPSQPLNTTNGSTTTVTGIQQIVPASVKPDFTTLPAGASAVNANSKLFSGGVCASTNNLAGSLCGAIERYMTGAISPVATSGQYELFWYDPATRKMGYDSLWPLYPSGIGFGAIQLHFDLYFENPNKIFGRGTWLLPLDPAHGHPADPNTGQLNCSLNMARMADGAVTR